MKHEFINWLRTRVPDERWEQVWLGVPVIVLLLLPIGSLILRALAFVGWAGAAQATQGLMLISVAGGVIVGSLVLWSAQDAHLDPSSYQRVLWLGRFAIVGPFLTLLIMFWVASVT
jgi:hypothetical protein